MGCSIASARELCVFKKYSQMKLTMKREVLQQINRRANEMTIDEAPAAPVYGGFGTVLVQ